VPRFRFPAARARGRRRHRCRSSSCPSHASALRAPARQVFDRSQVQQMRCLGYRIQQRVCDLRGAEGSRPVRFRMQINQLSWEGEWPSALEINAMLIESQQPETGKRRALMNGFKTSDLSIRSQRNYAVLNFGPFSIIERTISLLS
jgi:hypothetical protein